MKAYPPYLKNSIINIYKNNSSNGGRGQLFMSGILARFARGFYLRDIHNTWEALFVLRLVGMVHR